MSSKPPKWPRLAADKAYHGPIFILDNFQAVYGQERHMQRVGTMSAQLLHLGWCNSHPIRGTILQVGCPMMTGNLRWIRMEGGMMKWLRCPSCKMNLC